MSNSIQNLKKIKLIVENLINLKFTTLIKKVFNVFDILKQKFVLQLQKNIFKYKIKKTSKNKQCEQLKSN